MSTLANIAKGRIATYADLGLTNDAWLLVLLKSAGLVADATLRDYDDLAAVLAGASDEADFTGYARRTLTGVAAVVDDTGDIVNITATNPAAWTNSGGSAQAIGKAVFCYDSDTTGGGDASIIPVAFVDCTLTFDIGVATSITFDALGPLYAS